MDRLQPIRNWGYFSGRVPLADQRLGPIELKSLLFWLADYHFWPISHRACCNRTFWLAWIGIVSHITGNSVIHYWVQWHALLGITIYSKRSALHLNSYLLTWLYSDLFTLKKTDRLVSLERNCLLLPEPIWIAHIFAYILWGIRKLRMQIHRNVCKLLRNAYSLVCKIWIDVNLL